MNNAIIIGLTGVKRSGKDTFADIAIQYFVEKYKGERKCIRISFASCLKESVKLIYGIEVTDENKDKPIGGPVWKTCTPRDMVISLGDAARNFHKNSIVEGTKKKIQETIEKTDGVIIFVTDVRYDNEASMLINTFNAKIIKISRSHSFTKKSKKGIHSSEMGISSELIDNEVLNNKSLEEYKNDIKKVLNNLFY